MLLEAARLHEHAPLERADRGVEVLTALVESLAGVGEMAAHGRDPLVELAAELVDLRASCATLSCCHVAATERSSVNSVVGEASDAEPPAVLAQQRVLLLGGAEERLVGDEHDDEVRRVSELPPVALRASLPMWSRTWRA